jgi:hypothetical protein
VEETWRVVQPLLDQPPPLHVYPKGSWGPPEAARLVRAYPDWHEPWLPANPDGADPGAASAKPQGQPNGRNKNSGAGSGEGVTTSA